MIFGWIAAGLGLLFGLGGLGMASFEHRAAADIRRSLSGPKAEVHIESRSVGLQAIDGHFKRVTIIASHFTTSGLPLFTEPNRSKSGKIDELRIVLHDFSLRELHIRDLTSDIPNCRFDLGLAERKNRIRLSASGEGEGSVSIEEDDLERFLLAKYSSIKTAHVKIAGGKVHVWGYGEFLVLRTDFDVVSELSVVDGIKLNLTGAAITFNGRPADEASRNALLRTLNPVVDLNKDLGLFGAISVTKLSLENGTLVAEGATRIPDRE